MNTYIIMDISTNKILGEVNAFDVTASEYKACGIWPEVKSDYIAAFNKNNF